MLVDGVVLCVVTVGVVFVLVVDVVVIGVVVVVDVVDVLKRSVDMQCANFERTLLLLEMLLW